MFVVIQAVQLRKPNKSGAYRKYKVDAITFTFQGKTKTSYSYGPDYSAGRFERPHREAYKISLRQSFRESGNVKAKQCVLGTIEYYALAEDWPLYDLLEAGIGRAAVMFPKCDNLFELAEAKIKPLREAIQWEYYKTDEYKSVRERDRLQKQYQKDKTAFAKKYGTNADEYDYCYDIFGHLMNADHLGEIVRRAEAYSSYRESDYNTYEQSNSRSENSSYFNSESGNYSEDERRTLKIFYKRLAMEFHPDRNPGADTTREMQLLNRLKDVWGL